MWVNTAPINTVVSNETLKTSKDDFNIDNQSVNICVHARLLQADPSPAPGEGWRAPARIATPAETCGPIRSHCRGAAANQRARPRDWTTGPPTPRTDTPDPGERERRQRDAVRTFFELMKLHLLFLRLCGRVTCSSSDRWGCSLSLLFSRGLGWDASGDR